MDIVYRDKRTEKICTDYSSAEKAYGKDIAMKLHLRLDQIAAASSIEMMIQSRIGGCHKLKGNRDNQYALHLAEPHRLIIMEDIAPNTVKIWKVEDYHGKQ